MAHSSKKLKKFSVKEEAISDDDVKILECPVKVEPKEESENGLDEISNPSPKKTYKRIRPPRDDSGSSDGDDSADEYRRMGVKQKRQRKQPAVVKIESSESSESSSSEAATSDESDSSDVQEVPSRRTNRRHKHKSDSDSEEPEIEFSSGDEGQGQGTDKSYTSTEESEEEDKSDEVCIVCRNLGDTVIKGRKFSSSTSWCTCHECKIWKRSMGDYDRVCCRELADIVSFLNDELEVDENTCITSHPRFEQDVLRRRALQRTNYSLTNNYGNSEAYMASWSFIRWIFNRIGWGTRIMIPACVRAKILETYPNDYLTNFCPVKTCSKGKHCK